MRELQPDAPAAEEISRAAAVLYEAGARAVWLFGSRVRRRPDRLSDFDLCVEGLGAGSSALARAAAELRGHVDIIPMEAAPAALRWCMSSDRVFVPWVLRSAGRRRRSIKLPDTLAGTRTGQVARLVRESGARSVIDFGCGAGWLLAELATDAGIEKLTGVDFKAASLSGARRRLSYWCGADVLKRVRLHEGLITHRDPVFQKHDSATAIEVIEHLHPPQLKAFERVLFEFARPLRVVVTTPNAEYNVMWAIRHPRGHRHADHRFEWSRVQFGEWAAGIAREWGYGWRVEPVGPVHPELGPPTQLAVFDRPSTCAEETLVEAD